MITLNNKMDLEIIQIQSSSKKFKLLGGEIEIALYDVDPIYAELLFEEINAEGLRLQKIFNFFDPESELSQLNRILSLQCSNDLVFVVKEALTYAKLTDGAYDVGLGRQALERKRGMKESPIIGSYKNIQISDNTITLNHPDILIDLGSIAKGYIAEKLLDFIKINGIESAFINARGDLACYGNVTETVVIEHPRDKTKIIDTLHISNSAIATSGDYKQYYGSYDKSHIIGSQDLISVTVIADNLTKADACATAIFVLGSSKAAELVKRIKGISVIMVDKDINITRLKS